MDAACIFKQIEYLLRHPYFRKYKADVFVFA